MERHKLLIVDDDQFLQEQLGWALKEDFDLVQCHDRESALQAAIAERPDLAHPASIIYYQVDDIEKVYETLKARGVEFIIKPHLVAPMPTYDLWLADFKDSEDNILALMSEVPRKVA